MRSILQNQLRNRISKQEIDIFVEALIDGRVRLSDIKKLLSDDSVLFNVSWILATLAQKNAVSLSGFEGHILEMIKDYPENETVVRNGLSVFKSIDIPESIEDSLFTESFRILQERTSPIAHRSFSLSVCVKIALKYPELKPELLQVSKLVLELYGDTSPGIKSSCTRAIKTLTPR